MPGKFELVSVVAKQEKSHECPRIFTNDFFRKRLFFFVFSGYPGLIRGWLLTNRFKILISQQVYYYPLQAARENAQGAEC